MLSLCLRQRWHIPIKNALPRLQSHSTQTHRPTFQHWLTAGAAKVGRSHRLVINDKALSASAGVGLPARLLKDRCQDHYLCCNHSLSVSLCTLSISLFPSAYRHCIAIFIDTALTRLSQVEPFHLKLVPASSAHTHILTFFPFALVTLERLLANDSQILFASFLH